MLDIKYIRENPEKVKKGVSAKQIEPKIVDELIVKYDKWTQTLQEYEKLRQRRNEIAKEGKFSQEGKDLKDKLSEAEKNNYEAWEEYSKAEDKMPNLPAEDVKEGKSDKENKAIYQVGKISTRMFTTRDHLELGELLDIVDIKRAAKVSGTRFAYLKNKAVILEFALVQYAFTVLMTEGFTPIIPPVLINEEITKGLGYWDSPPDEAGLTGNEDYYLVREPSENKNFYLVGTAEHSILPMHKDEVFSKNELPKRYVGFSSAFRREAGSYGKDTRGILRVHQFDKVEMVSFTTEEEDDSEQKILLKLEEKFWQELGIPYQVVEIVSGNLGFPIARKYDIEAWIPSESKYREVTSCSTTTDFQARRLNIKYNDKNEKKFVHILNGTAFAIGRTIIAILENFQEEDGTVIIPEVLRKYTGFEKISPKV